MSNSTNRHQELKAILDRLKLSGMAQHFPDLALRAAKEGLSHEAYLHELARQEEAIRQERRQNGCYANLACLWRKPSVLSSFRGFLPRSNSKSSGSRAARFSSTRSMSSRWGNQALEKVTCWPHLRMSSSCLVIPSGGRQPARSCNGSSPPNGTCACRSWQSWDKYACVILDDIGYIQHDRDEMEVLFTFLSDRYERKSVLITTNLVFSEWERIFTKNPMTTMAAIDRVIHHCVILDMMAVDSYRAHQAHHQHLSQVEEAGKSARINSQTVPFLLTVNTLIPRIAMTGYCWRICCAA